MSAFSIPLSGLEATSSSLNTIANNLANLNTDGYKDQRLDFTDVFNQVLGTSGNGDPIQTGSGVQVNGTTADFTNGALSSTGVASNMALQGNGFFVVQNGTQTTYTRAGDFTVNSSGQLATPDGKLVMGYPAVDGVVSTSGALAPISVDQATTIPAVATTSFSANTNLNSSGGVGSTFSTPITVYDSLGASQELTINYTNTATNTWSYNITLPACGDRRCEPDHGCFRHDDLQLFGAADLAHGKYHGHQHHWSGRWRRAVEDDLEPERYRDEPSHHAGGFGERNGCNQPERLWSGNACELFRAS